MTVSDDAVFIDELNAVLDANESAHQRVQAFLRGCKYDSVEERLRDENRELRTRVGELESALVTLEARNQHLDSVVASCVEQCDAAKRAAAAESVAAVEDLESDGAA